MKNSGTRTDNNVFWNFEFPIPPPQRASRLEFKYTDLIQSTGPLINSCLGRNTPKEIIQNK